jgi:hypothetical protein
MLISLRGTHGSGKSTAVKNLLTRYSGKEILGEKGKPEGYKLEVPWLKLPVYVVGSYRTACGGCDGIQPYALIWPRIVEYAKGGHVLFEGALVSSSYGNIGRASEIYGSECVFAFMDTPLATCIKWVKARRAARGDKKPLNPHNLVQKYKAVKASIIKIRDEFKRRVVLIDHKRPSAHLLEILTHGEREFNT